MTATLNIGLNIGDEEALTRFDAVATVEFVAPDVAVLAVEEALSETENTAVITVSRALTELELELVCDILQQEAVAQWSEAEGGQLAGPMADQWGPFNPAYFLHAAAARRAA